ncbi:hypothetical protein C8A03DRAFT_31621 [Achaetomium macrosporum]|uniref:General transcription and DNA repair factor IIH n=1 Tax=Achaetomium macrosporum TaxID=79813 RepID=A0AAN7CEC8_9PEZI|nr:hypothetical protein C8A03DRAFT_31621 [Achaetomium macrosporum]
MADSDGEYVDDLSEDDLNDNRVTSGADGSSYGTRSKGARASGKRGDGRKAKGGARSKAAWEDIKRSWENVVETEDGSITIEALIEAEKRRRLMRDTTPLQRGIIRHLMLVLDMSFAMAEKDLLPNRYLLTLNYAVEFVREYFEQNPISQMGVVGMRDGIAVRISDMGGNPAEHIEKLRAWAEQQEPQGNPSLQNALEMCRGSLFHTPSHGTREVLIIYGALLSSDPGDIHDTISNLLSDRIRVSIVGLAAQVAICGELCSRTNGGDPSAYSVALHEQHFRELFLAATTPPATHSSPNQTDNQAALLMMGFPSRTLASKDHVSFCACHHRPTREGYACTRCKAKVCRLPAECPICGLTLVLSTHLARSYHHLFPLKGWVEVPWSEAGKSVACYSCLMPFPPAPAAKGGKQGNKGKTAAPGSGKEDGDPGTEESRKRSLGVAAPVVVREAKTAGVSESGRYACQVCGNHFCIDCDVFAHEVIHNCPGCQSDIRSKTGGDAQGNGEAVHGQDNGAGEAMAID